MTIKDIKYIVRRYAFIAMAIKEKLDVIKFYVGHRREVIVVDETVKTVKQVIDDVYDYERETWMQKMMKKVQRGDKDIKTIQDFPYERSAYYMKKRRFINKVYSCCIAKSLVSYDEALREEIA